MILSSHRTARDKRYTKRVCKQLEAAGDRFDNALQLLHDLQEGKFSLKSKEELQ